MGFDGFHRSKGKASEIPCCRSFTWGCMSYFRLWIVVQNFQMKPSDPFLSTPHYRMHISSKSGRLLVRAKSPVSDFQPSKLQSKSCGSEPGRSGGLFWISHTKIHCNGRDPIVFPLKTKLEATAIPANMFRLGRLSFQKVKPCSMATWTEHRNLIKAQGARPLRSIPCVAFSGCPRPTCHACA